MTTTSSFTFPCQRHRSSIMTCTQLELDWFLLRSIQYITDNHKRDNSHSLRSYYSSLFITCSFTTFFLGTTQYLYFRRKFSWDTNKVNIYKLKLKARCHEIFGFLTNLPILLICWSIFEYSQISRMYLHVKKNPWWHWHCLVRLRAVIFHFGDIEKTTFVYFEFPATV